MLFRNPMPNHILELVEPERLLELINALSDALGCDTTILDQHGEPAVSAPRRGEFCTLISSHLPVGDQCQRCHAELDRRALEQGGLARGRCHLGLELIRVPILVDGRHVATLGASNMAQQEPNRELLTKLAEENDIPLAMLVAKADSICILTTERLSAVERLIRVVAQQIGDLCHQRHHLMRRLN
ncbi:MAG: PocR ligand-binding domain-containing protein [Bacillota bacterium]